MRRDRQGLEGHGGGRGVGRVGESGGGNQGERALQVGINDDNHMLSTCTKNCKKQNECVQQVSNPRPIDFESTALPTTPCRIIHVAKCLQLGS